MNPTIMLNWLNFFIADVRDGLGPFLGVFLQQHNWAPDHIGYVMTLGGLAGMIATTPMGILADAIHAKRALILIASILIITACSVNYFYPYFVTTAIAQMLIAIAGAAVPPAIWGITLGIVGSSGFAHQLGQNEAFNHAGNASSALLAGIFSYFYGLSAVFLLMGILAICSVVCVIGINPNHIDYKKARGNNSESTQKVRFTQVLGNKTLLLLAITVALFHMANAAMLPLLGQSMVAEDMIDSAGAYTAMTIIVAQVAMIPMALFAAKWSQTHSYNLILILALVALPVRGIVAASFHSPWVVFPVQILDGVGAGLLGVAIPGLVEKILRGTGHFNAGLAALITIQGIGASFSTSIGGVVARYFSYETSFLALSGIALMALILWYFVQPIVKHDVLN